MRIILPVFLLIALGACSHSSQTTSAEHHYPLSGKVVRLDAQHQTAMVDAAAIPNFMEAMTMEYPVKSKADFDRLHAGDRIKATVNVSEEGSYNLSGIQIQQPAK